MVVGCTRMILDFVYPTPQCYESDTRPDIIKYVHYLYFSIILTLLTLTVVVCVSLATEKPTPEQISRLTWYTRFDPVKESEEVVVSDLQTFEDATVYPKDMENDAYPTKEGTLSNPYAGTETVNGNVHCPVYSDLFCFKPISLTLKVQLSSRGRQSHLLF